MSDRPFLDLVTKEAIDNINIDKKLIPIFNSAMRKIQYYFEKKGYTNIVNYGKLFQNYLSSLDGFRNLKIKLGNIPKIYRARGVYSYYNSEITINKKMANEPDKIEKTLIHEFIHFLVMHDMKVNAVSEIEDIKVFLNEGLTEILTSKILGKAPNGYEAQVKLVQLYLDLVGEEFTFVRFLQGKLEPPFINDDWLKFLELSNQYHHSTNRGEFILNKAMFNQNYVAAQKHLIKYALTNANINNYDEFRYIYDKINNAPARHVDHVIETLRGLEFDYIKSNNLDDIEDIIRSKFREIQHNYTCLTKYHNKDVAEYFFADEKLVITEDGEILTSPITNLIIKKNQNNNYISRIINSRRPHEFIDIDIRNIDFKKRKIKIQDDLNKLEGLFHEYYEKDFDKIRNIIQSKEGIVKLEKFTMPLVNYKETKIPEIYLIHYKDGVELIGDIEPNGVTYNINANMVRSDGRILDNAYTIEKALKYNVLGTDKEILVYDRNNVISMSVLHNNKSYLAFSDVVIDTNKDAKLNDVFNELSKTKSKNKVQGINLVKENNSLNIDNHKDYNRNLFEYNLIVQNIKRLKTSLKLDKSLSIKDELKHLNERKRYLSNKLNISEEKHSIRSSTITPNNFKENISNDGTKRR